MFSPLAAGGVPASAAQACTAAEDGKQPSPNACCTVVQTSSAPPPQFRINQFPYPSPKLSIAYRPDTPPAAKRAPTSHSSASSRSVNKEKRPQRITAKARARRENGRRRASRNTQTGRQAFGRPPLAAQQPNCRAAADHLRHPHTTPPQAGLGRVRCVILSAPARLHPACAARLRRRGRKAAP